MTAKIIRSDAAELIRKISFLILVMLRDGVGHLVMLRPISCWKASFSAIFVKSSSPTEAASLIRPGILWSRFPYKSITQFRVDNSVGLWYSHSMIFDQRDVAPLLRRSATIEA